MTIEAFFTAMEDELRNCAPDPVSGPKHELWARATPAEEEEFFQRFPFINLPPAHVELLRRHNGAMLDFGWIHLFAWEEVDRPEVAIGPDANHQFPNTWLAIAEGQDDGIYAVIDTATAEYLILPRMSTLPDVTPEPLERFDSLELFLDWIYEELTT